MKTMTNVKAILNEEELDCLRKSVDIFDDLLLTMDENNTKEITISTDLNENFNYTYTSESLEDIFNMLDQFLKLLMN